MVATTDDAFTKKRRDGGVANVIVRVSFYGIYGNY